MIHGQKKFILSRQLAIAILAITGGCRIYAFGIQSHEQVVSTDLFSITKKPIASMYKSCTDLSKPNDKPHTHWITVFVHGIKSIKPHVSFDNFFRFMGDNVDGTVYSKTVELMRTDPHFFQNQAMQRIGLHAIDQFGPAEPGNAPRAMAILFDEINNRIGANEINHYYTYGWSGLLSPRTRYQESIPFLEQLDREVKKYRSQGIQTNIRLIGYSHGGNVCLNVARAYQEVFPDCTFKINELILVGSPIQGETDYLINSPIFESVYNFYSHGDRIQKLDFFSYDRFFSGQTFTERTNFKLPAKLHQVQIKVMRNTPKTNKCPRRSLLATNINNSAILTGNTHLIRDASPGHSELWFFGWTPVSYRQYYPLHPLPTISFAPVIIKQLKELSDDLPSPDPVVADIRPDNGLVIVRSPGALQPLKACRALGTQDIMQLKDLVRPFKPHNYTPQKYDDHIRLAYEHARVYHAYKHVRRNPLAARNQQKLQEVKYRQSLQQQKKILKKNELSMDVSMHLKRDCPYCKRTYQTIAYIYRIDSQIESSSSTRSCCARKLSIESGIFLS